MGRTGQALGLCGRGRVWRRARRALQVARAQEDVREAAAGATATLPCAGAYQREGWQHRWCVAARRAQPRLAPPPGVRPQDVHLLPLSNAADEANLLRTLRAGEVKAIVLDAPWVKFTAAAHCDLFIVGDMVLPVNLVRGGEGGGGDVVLPASLVGAPPPHRRHPPPSRPLLCLAQGRLFRTPLTCGGTRAPPVPLEPRLRTGSGSTRRRLPSPTRSPSPT